MVEILAFNSVKVRFLDRFPGLQKINLVSRCLHRKEVVLYDPVAKLPGPSTPVRSIFTRLLSERAAGSQNRLRAYYTGPRRPRAGGIW